MMARITPMPSSLPASRMPSKTLAALLFAMAFVAIFSAAGCNSNGLLTLPSSNPYDEPSVFSSKWWAKPAPKDEMVLPGNGSGNGTPDSEHVATDDRARRDIEEAKQLYQSKEYAKAERMFNLIAKAKKLPVDVQEDAVFYRGECQRLQANYREAEGSLKLYIKSYPYGRHTKMANERLFDIADYWLNPTRERMKRAEDEREGRSAGFAMPASWFHFSRDMPFNDVEGHAIGILEEVRLNDIKGRLAERSLFYIATIKFFNADYKEADFYYSQIVEHYPQSDLCATSMKQSIICKQIVNGGTAYDTRLVEKCRSYLEEFSRAYPGKDQEWIRSQLISINHQQADRDFNIAEFYRRTGHPGSAYFYYEIVRRRYPNTEYARRAEAHMNDLRSRVSADQAGSSAMGGDAENRPWYQNMVDTFGPTRTVLDPAETGATPAATGAQPGRLPNLDTTPR